MSAIGKPGELRAGWRKRQEDVIYVWSEGVSRSDVRLIHALIEELDRRGYDLATFKLKVKKHREVTNGRD